MAWSDLKWQTKSLLIGLLFYILYGLFSVMSITLDSTIYNPLDYILNSFVHSAFFIFPFFFILFFIANLRLNYPTKGFIMGAYIPLFVALYSFMFGLLVQPLGFGAVMGIAVPLLAAPLLSIVGLLIGWIIGKLR